MEAIGGYRFVGKERRVLLGDWGEKLTVVHPVRNDGKRPPGQGRTSYGRDRQTDRERWSRA